MLFYALRSIALRFAIGLFAPRADLAYATAAAGDTKQHNQRSVKRIGDVPKLVSKLRIANHLQLKTQNS
jgi:hypothetical protein